MCEKKRRISLIGIGVGSCHAMTGEALDTLKNCDCIIGAQRMLDSVRQLGKHTYSSYKPEEIRRFIESHQEYRAVAVVLSGDVGFYSGAKKLEEELAGCQVERIPGISSIVYLAARLHTSWEDAALISAHGRRQNYIHAIGHQEKTFLLLGGDCGRELCEKLHFYQLTEIDCWIGKHLSYPDEVVLHKKGGELRPEDFSDLDVVFISNPKADRGTMRHLEDEEFIRGRVPMTKSEVRAVSLAKLGLKEACVLYDIGAGTGSIAIEAAVHSGGIRVYAVEKNPEAVRLLKENKQRFRCDWLDIVEGRAPEALRGLEAPTHVFIGGSAGDLKEILAAVKRKNPQVRIVLNAISLETVREVMEAVEEGLLEEPEIVQLAASKSRKLGAYHMMTGMNPVYIITDGGQKRDGGKEDGSF